jgi:hypothetical protein
MSRTSYVNVVTKFSSEGVASTPESAAAGAAATEVAQSIVQQVSQLSAGMILGTAYDAETAYRIAMQGYATGGYVSSTAPALVHAGEFVLSRDMLGGKQSIPREVQRAMITNQSTTNQPITVNAVTNADPFLISREIAWAIRTGV